MTNMEPGFSEREGVLTRRTVLAGSGATAILLMLPLPSAFAEDPTPALSTVPGPTKAVWRSGGQALNVPWVLGATVGQADSPTGVPQSSQVQIDFDPAMYELLADPRVTANGEAVRHRVVTRTQSRITVQIDEAVDAGVQIDLVVGTLRPQSYPYDTLRLGRGPQGNLELPDGRRGHTNRPSPKEQSAWGAEVDAHWRVVSWGEDYRTFVPSIAVIRSTGPGTAPRSLALTVRVDPRILRNVRVSPMAGQRAQLGKHSSRDGQTLIPLTARLAAGDTITLSISGTLLSPLGSLEGFMMPAVSLSPRKLSVGQRTTGRETTTRLDSIYDRFSRDEFRVT